MKKLILRSNLSPGDIVMMTAAVRDLHAAHPGQFLTDVRTPCPDLWMHNPHITPIADGEGEELHLHYPLIQRSNQTPHHFIHGYRMDLERQLGLSIPAGPFRGDIHLSNEERGWLSQVEEIMGRGARFWIIVSGGKFDFTAKWWDPARWQGVVDRFPTRTFVQVGDGNHKHPPLRRVLDLRGKTTMRQLVRLVHHADGVLCPVTSLMHLAAAVPTKEARLRPCVVVAGGREPSQWEAYPGHRFLDTIGSLPCCATGGCWKSRVVPLNDGDEKDKSLCVRPVEVRGGHIPQCLDLISVDDVVRAVESYSVEVRPEKTIASQAKAPCGTPCPKKATKGTHRMRVKSEDARVWGPRKWAELHRRPDRCRNLADEPDWIARFHKSIPCPECRDHFNEVLAAHPPTLETRESYFAWTVAVHNAVRRKLGRSEFTLREAQFERDVRHALDRRMPTCVRCDNFVPANEKESPRCVTAGLLRRIVDNPKATCPIGKWPMVARSEAGLVIGTYASVPYVHLQLEARRRNHPHVACLVVDDGSGASDKLRELCEAYGADFLGLAPRRGHVAGDMTAFVEGMEWARQGGIKFLVKFSRRWIPLVPWVSEMVDLFSLSEAPTLSARCEFHGFGFRSECVAMDVAAWIGTDAMAPLRSNIEGAMRLVDPRVNADNQHIFLVEHIVHQAATRAAAAAAPKWKADQVTHPPHPGCDNYTPWPLMGNSRRQRRDDVLWHEWARAEDYLRALNEWGITAYTMDDMIDHAGNIRR